MVCINEVFAKNLRRMRREKGMSPEQLAKKAGLATGSVYGWETARYLPSLYPALCLVEALGCTVEDLVRGEEDG